MEKEYIYNKEMKEKHYNKMITGVNEYSKKRQLSHIPFKSEHIYGTIHNNQVSEVE